MIVTGTFIASTKIVIFFSRSGAATHSQNSVFAVEINLTFPAVIRDEIGNAPAEIYVRAVGQFLAARCAICSRASRGLSGITNSFRFTMRCTKIAGVIDMFRLDSADGHDFFDLDDGRLRGHGHDGIEISRRKTVRQIPQFIGSLRLDERIIRVNAASRGCSASLR